MKGKKILIIGDVMLDRYIMGTVNRISPEAPVPVVNVRSEKLALGGAANVASNVRALGGIPLLLGTVGDDDTARIFKDTVESLGIRSEYLVVDKKRPTTIKTRVVANNQQVVRIDQEVNYDLSSRVERMVLSRARKLIRMADAVILEDYNKGLLSPSVIKGSIKHAKEAGKPVTVDPKVKNFFYYRGVFLFKPNEKELLGAVGEASTAQMEDADFLQKVRKRIGCQNLLVTRGSKGMVLFGRNGTPFSIPTVAREVYDVSGAGDTVISVATMALSVGATIKESAIIANYAAGVGVSRAGVAAITPDEILASYDLNNGSAA
jgi:D-beta-D-heptose 7-phosphate kinase/D-beta-D-heptose 1-phosphate adenosyltransferase